MDASKPENDRLTIREAAAELRISKDVIYSMAAAGEIDHYRIRGRIFIPREAIVKFLKANFYPAHRDFFHRKSAFRTQTNARVS